MKLMVSGRQIASVQELCHYGQSEEICLFSSIIIYLLFDIFYDLVYIYGIYYVQYHAYWIGVFYFNIMTLFLDLVSHLPGTYMVHQPLWTPAMHIAFVC